MIMKWPWKVTSPYGAIDNVHTLPHSGIDLATPMDTPIQAPESGIVDRITHEGSQSFGNAVWVREPDGYRIVFAHLDKTNVYRGERIHAGDIIGLSGNTGHSTGPHLHIGVLSPDGKWVNPDKYFGWQHWMSRKSNDIKNAEDDYVVSHVEGWIGQIAKDLLQDFGEWILHQIAPIALTVFALSMLGVILHVQKAPKWAFYSGLLATIGYHEGWD